MNCKNCGKEIRQDRNYEGNWVHTELIEDRDKDICKPILYAEPEQTVWVLTRYDQLSRDTTVIGVFDHADNALNSNSWIEYNTGYQSIRGSVSDSLMPYTVK